MESKTRPWPSGDQRGSRDTLANEVNCSAFKPSLSHTQISRVPERPEVNAIFLPSGEYWAVNSLRDEEMNFVDGLVSPRGPGISTRQMS